MSGPKCVDLRTSQLRMNQQMMRDLQRTLAATPLAVTTETIEIRTSQIDAVKESIVAQQAHAQDKMEIKDTTGLQAQLTAGVKNDYTVDKLADWQPFDMSQLNDPQVTVTKEARDPVTHLKMEEDFFSSVLDACFAVVSTGEVDENGEQIVVLAVDESLIGDDGEWKDKSKKQKWDDAVTQVMAANRAAQGVDRTSKTKQDDARLRAANRAAGGNSVQRTNEPPATTAEPVKQQKKRTMNLGGSGDD